MAIHLQTGQNGEDAAVDYLNAKGYKMVAKNWRYKHLEVDIIAEDQGILAFVEVKTRAQANYGMPYEAVNSAKQAKLVRAANQYIASNRYNGEIRFDIVSILYDKTKGTYHIRLIKDAFWPD